MTGNDDHQRVAVGRLAHRPSLVAAADQGGQFAVGQHRAIGNAPHGLPHRQLEFGTDRSQRQVKDPQPAGEIGPELALGLDQDLVPTLPPRVYPAIALDAVDGVKMLGVGMEGQFADR